MAALSGTLRSQPSLPQPPCFPEEPVPRRRVAPFPSSSAVLTWSLSIPGTCKSLMGVPARGAQGAGLKSKISLRVLALFGRCWGAFYSSLSCLNCVRVSGTRIKPHIQAPLGAAKHGGACDCSAAQMRREPAGAYVKPP